MAELPDELKELATVATGMVYPSNLRTDAIKEICKLGTHEALLILLEIAGNESMVRKERELALKQALQIVKSSPS